MARLVKSIVIGASAEQICGYLNTPTNLPEIWPGMVEATDVQSLPNGGKRFHWVYKMAGMRLEGDSEDTEFIANELVVSETRGGIRSTVTWMLRPEGDGTKVTFDVEYTVPVPLLGKLAEAFIVRVNEHESETLLANLKARMEA
jgi:uncharacterized membrane protein